MGNSASKKAHKAELARVEESYKDTTAALASRDQELAQSHKGLEVSKAQEQRLANEAETLREKYAELERLSAALELERENHVAQLQAELKAKDDEAEARRRVVEARTRERDEAKVRAAQLEEQMRKAERESHTKEVELQRHRAEFDMVANGKEQELQRLKMDMGSLAEKARVAEMERDELSARFEAARATAEKELAAARETATHDLVTSRANAAAELATTKASMSDSAKSMASVSLELAETRSALTSARMRLDALQKTHNASVTRGAASHEAFTALKQELADTQQKYLALNTEHTKLRGNREVLDAEVAVLRKRLLSMETRKGVMDLSMQDVGFAGRDGNEGTALMAA